MKKTILTAAVGLTLAASVNAGDIYVTGATAFRSSFYAALQAAMPGAEVMGASDSAMFTFKGTWTGPAPLSGAQTIYCSWSGSVEGIETLLNNATPTFTNVVSDGGGTRTHTADFAFSDVCQSSTAFAPAFGFSTLVDATVGVVPFVFANNPVAESKGIFNMSDRNFQVMAGSGTLPLAMFVDGCDPDYDTTVYLTGRNSFSGTRTTTFSETGYGVFTPCQQFHNGEPQTASPGRVKRKSGVNVATAVAHIANDGWESGGNVKDDLKNSICTDAFVGYLSTSDAKSIGANLADSETRYLAYNGYRYSKCAVIAGQYTFWSYEHIMSKAADPRANSFIAAIDANLAGIYCNSDYPDAIPQSAMIAIRSCEGGDVTP